MSTVADNHFIEGSLTKEFKSKNFTLLVEFLKKGKVIGLFIVNQHNSLLAQEVEDGLYVQHNDELYFSFSVTWKSGIKAVACTYFSGHIQRLEDDEERMHVDWLLVQQQSLPLSSQPLKGHFTIGSDPRKYCSVSLPGGVALPRQAYTREKGAALYKKNTIDEKDQPVLFSLCRRKQIFVPYI
jgi:hypothetical protein